MLVPLPDYGLACDNNSGGLYPLNLLEDSATLVVFLASVESAKKHALPRWAEAAFPFCDGNPSNKLLFAFATTERTEERLFDRSEATPALQPDQDPRGACEISSTACIESLCLKRFAEFLPRRLLNLALKTHYVGIQG